MTLMMIIIMMKIIIIVIMKIIMMKIITVIMIIINDEYNYSDNDFNKHYLSNIDSSYNNSRYLWLGF